MKLTIELVPQTCWFSNLRSNVSPSDWNKLKRMTSEKAGALCEVCGGRGPKWPVECHEIWQYDDAALTQTLSGLVALCPDCHEVKHIGFASTRGRLEIATEHLARVNQMTPGEAQAYVSESFNLWSKRSRKQWKLDVTWLVQHGIVEIKTRPTP